MRQLKEWEEYFSVEPWGDDQDEGRNWLLCSLLANVHRDTKSKPEPERAMTDEEIEAQFDRIFGG